MESLCQPGTTRRLLLESGLAYAYEIIPCSEAELQEIEKLLKLSPLPGAYRQFISEAGWGAGLFAKDENLFYPKMLEARNTFNEVVRKDHHLVPEHEHVFYQHDGYEFYLFDMSHNPVDPPVVRRLEMDVEGVPIASSFTRFIVEWIRCDRVSYDKIDPKAVEARLNFNRDYPH